MCVSWQNLRCEQSLAWHMMRLKSSSSKINELTDDLSQILRYGIPDLCSSISESVTVRRLSCEPRE